MALTINKEGLDMLVKIKEIKIIGRDYDRKVIATHQVVCDSVSRALDLYSDADCDDLEYEIITED